MYLCMYACVLYEGIREREERVVRALISIVKHERGGELVIFPCVYFL